MRPAFFYRVLPYLACLAACSAVNILYFPPALVFPDEQRFWASAVHLAATGQFRAGGDLAYEMPGPAAVFALFIHFAGAAHAIYAIRGVQSLLLLLQCGMIGVIARRVWRDDAAAFTATCIAAVYPFFLFYQGLLLSETLFDTALLAALAVLFVWRDRGARIDALLVAACALFATATYMKASLTLVPPLLIGITALLSRASWRRSAGATILALALYCGLLTPWWVRNAVELQAFVPFTTSSGQNLYLGNNPRNPDGGVDWATNVDQIEAARLFAVPNEVARNKAFTAEAVTYIQAHPVAFLIVALKKFVRFWSPVPNAAGYQGVYAFISLATFVPVLILAAFALIRWWRNWRATMPLVLTIGYFTLLYVVTIASVRYRLPIEPLLIALAAQPLSAGLLAILARRAGSI
jgi:hypothetical protein